MVEITVREVTDENQSDVLNVYKREDYTKLSTTSEYKNGKITVRVEFKDNDYNIVEEETRDGTYTEVSKLVDEVIERVRKQIK